MQCPFNSCNIILPPSNIYKRYKIKTNKSLKNLNPTIQDKHSHRITVAIASAQINHLGNQRKPTTKRMSFIKTIN